MNECVQLPVAGRARSEFEVGDLEGTGYDGVLRC